MRENTIHNFVVSTKGIKRDIAERLVKQFSKADPELGDGLAKGFGFPVTKSKL